MTSLDGKVALVTGASRGIGRAVALTLARAGLSVAVNYRTREIEAQEVVRAIHAIGRKTLAVQADVASASEITRMVTCVREALGPIDVLINNAGSARPQSWREIGETDWRAVLDNNLTSAFLVTQAVLPDMCLRRWGRIVNISSGAVQTGGVVGVHYTAAKAGMLGLTVRRGLRGILCLHAPRPAGPASIAVRAVARGGLGGGGASTVACLPVTGRLRQDGVDQVSLAEPLMTGHPNRLGDPL